MWQRQQILTLVLIMFGVSAIHAFNEQSTCAIKAESHILKERLNKNLTDFDWRKLQIESFNNATEICSNLKELKALSTCVSMNFDESGTINLDNALKVLIDDFYCNKNVTMKSRDMWCLEIKKESLKNHSWFDSITTVYGFKQPHLNLTDCRDRLGEADQLLINCSADERKFATAVKTVASYGRNACGHGDLKKSNDTTQSAKHVSFGYVLLMLVVIMLICLFLAASIFVSYSFFKTKYINSSGTSENLIV